MQISLGLNLKLKKVKDSDNALVIYGLPSGLVQQLREYVPPGEYVLAPTIMEEESETFPRTPIVEPGQVSTNSATYQSISKWTVGAKKGKLKAVAFASDTPDTGQWKLTIRGDSIFADEKQQNAMNLDFEDLELKKGDIVEVLGKSDGATTVLFDGLIQGEEIG